MNVLLFSFQESIPSELKINFWNQNFWTWYDSLGMRLVHRKASLSTQDNKIETSLDM
jgi:hypothetical protein